MLCSKHTTIDFTLFVSSGKFYFPFPILKDLCHTQDNQSLNNYVNMYL